MLGSICEAWAQVVHLDFGMRGGLIVCSVYLEIGVGLAVSTKNWQRLMCVAETMNPSGKPFVIGGDFYSSPKALVDAC